MSQTPKRNWGHWHLPPDLIDAARFLAKKNGYGDQEHLFLYKLLKDAYPDEMGLITPLYGLEWLDEPPG